MKTKYKFVETTGCTAFDFSANGNSLSELTDVERSEILDYLLLKIKEGVQEQAILLENVVQLFQYDDYEHDPNICEQCGDTVTTTTWNI
jgi:RNA polymerase subunit RPABC4/transcription elongation factor Spt4